MDLIYCRGLNCHLACIINIANVLGVNYPEAFAGLWSEMDFTDEAKYNIYVSGRVFANLETIGIRTEKLDCDEMNIKESMSQIREGELFFVGMDTFYIPWHQVFGHFHDPHYFFAQKEAEDTMLCFDPVYNKKDIRIKSSDIFSSVFELGRVYKVETSQPQNGLAQEARAVLQGHPGWRERLAGEILTCKGEGKDNLTVLIKQINAMINNRYLFRRYWEHAACISDHGDLFNENYFLKWEAVRNGLYKASIVKDNKSVVDEVCDLFSGLMDEEIGMAKEIDHVYRDTESHEQRFCDSS